MLHFLLVTVVSYLLGCVVAGYYIGRALGGGDIRRVGSGNAGARNVARAHGRLAAGLTLAFDAAKAVGAVLLAQRVLPVEWGAWLALCAVIAGHVWPVQLGFRGGKGVAPALGGVATADIAALAVAAGVFLVVLLFTRRFTPSGLVAIAAAPLALIFLDRSWPVVTLALIGVTIVLLAHHPRADARRRAAFAETAR